MSQNHDGPPQEPAATPRPGAPSAPGSAPWAGGPAAPSSSRPAPRRLTQAMMILAAVLILVHLASFVFGFLTAALVTSFVSGPTGDIFTVILLVQHLIAALAFAVQVALLVLSIIVVMQGRGRVRTGGIVVLAALVLGAGRWLVFTIIRAALTASMSDDSTALTSSLGTSAMVEFAVTLLLFAVIVVGAVIAWRAARRPADGENHGATPHPAPLRPLD